MEKTLIEFFIEKTGKKPEQITHEEYNALNISIDYMLEENKIKYEKFKKSKEC